MVKIELPKQFTKGRMQLVSDTSLMLILSTLVST